MEPWWLVRRYLTPRSTTLYYSELSYTNIFQFTSLHHTKIEYTTTQSSALRSVLGFWAVLEEAGGNPGTGEYLAIPGD